jgi:hypothetical protein
MQESGLTNVNVPAASHVHEELEVLDRALRLRRHLRCSIPSRTCLQILLSCEPRLAASGCIEETYDCAIDRILGARSETRWCPMLRGCSILWMAGALLCALVLQSKMHAARQTKTFEVNHAFLLRLQHWQSNTQALESASADAQAIDGAPSSEATLASLILA